MALLMETDEPSPPPIEGSSKDEHMPPAVGEPLLKARRESKQEDEEEEEEEEEVEQERKVNPRDRGDADDSDASSNPSTVGELKSKRAKPVKLNNLKKNKKQKKDKTKADKPPTKRKAGVSWAAVSGALLRPGDVIIYLSSGEVFLPRTARVRKNGQLRSFETGEVHDSLQAWTLACGDKSKRAWNYTYTASYVPLDRLRSVAMGDWKLPREVVMPKRFPPVLWQLPRQQRVSDTVLQMERCELLDGIVEVDLDVIPGEEPPKYMKEFGNLVAEVVEWILQHAVVFMECTKDRPVLYKVHMSSAIQEATRVAVWNEWRERWWAEGHGGERTLRAETLYTRDGIEALGVDEGPVHTKWIKWWKCIAPEVVDKYPPNAEGCPEKLLRLIPESSEEDPSLADDQDDISEFLLGQDDNKTQETPTTSPTMEKVQRSKNYSLLYFPGIQAASEFLPTPTMGVNEVVSYIGESGTGQPAHLEDYVRPLSYREPMEHLAALNYCVIATRDDPKIWRCTDFLTDEGDEIIEAMDHTKNGCPFRVQHKVKCMPDKLFTHTVVQKAGDLIVQPSYSIHQVTNRGRSVAVSQNCYPYPRSMIPYSSYIPFGSECRCGIMGMVMDEPTACMAGASGLDSRVRTTYAVKLR